MIMIEKSYFLDFINQWAEVDSLVEELQAIDGVETVTKGRFFLSPGLAPTFQVSSLKFHCSRIDIICVLYQ